MDDNKQEMSLPPKEELSKETRKGRAFYRICVVLGVLSVILLGIFIYEIVLLFI